MLVGPVSAAFALALPVVGFGCAICAVGYLVHVYVRSCSAAISFISYFLKMLPLIVTLTPLLNFLLMATFGRLVN
jgi:hypothetical protein